MGGREIDPINGRVSITVPINGKGSGTDPESEGGSGTYPNPNQSHVILVLTWLSKSFVYKQMIRVTIRVRFLCTSAFTILCMCHR